MYAVVTVLSPVTPGSTLRGPSRDQSVLMESVDQTSSQSGTLALSDFSHLSTHEWSALKRMAKVLGDASVVTLLRNLSPEEQRTAAVGFMNQEIENASARTPSSSLAPRSETLKLEVSKYNGDSKEPLLRWFVGKSRLP